MPFLVLDGLTKRYGKQAAVDGLSLNVAKGEFVTLLGPSGCGKSTTLQMIAGFVDPDGGAITLDGRNLDRVPANDRDIGVVFQSYALFPHQTVAENVAFGLEMRHIPEAQRSSRVTAMLERVDLQGLADRYPRQLSGGQQQRVALARALVIEPRLLLLDEPMSNLDVKLRESLQIELRQLQRQLRITTVLVTHDQNEAMALSDRVAVMRDGRILQVDAPAQAYDTPADAFTSTFLGKSNLFAADIVERSEDALVLSRGALTFPAAAMRTPRSAGSRVTCAIRPERIDIVEPSRGLVDGKVTAVIFLGNHWLIKVDTHLGDVLVFRQNVGSGIPPEGATVGLRWDAASVRLVDAEGQQ